MKRLNSLMKGPVIAFHYLLFISASAIAQKPLSQATIKDFANACEFQIRYNKDHNFMFVTLFNHVAVKSGGTDQAYTKFISTEIDKGAREDVFEAFNSISGGDPNKLYTYLFDWGLSAANAKQISTYISTKYAVKEEAPKRAENVLFQGTKRFTDADSVYCRLVTIKGNSITIQLFPASKNTEFKDKTKVIATETGYIKNGRIYIKDGNDYRADYYKIEEGKLIVNYDVGD